MKVPKNIKDKINQQSSKFNYGYISEGNKDTNVNIYIYICPYIHCSIICNSQNMEMT